MSIIETPIRNYNIDVKRFLTQEITMDDPEEIMKNMKIKDLHMAKVIGKIIKGNCKKDEIIEELQEEERQIEEDLKILTATSEELK